MKLYFARHGESEANVLHEFSNRGFKHPLTARGVWQAEDLARDFEGISFSRVYSSPVLRAIQTAKIVCDLAGIRTFVVDEDLREYDVGVFEGRTSQTDWDVLNRLEAGWTEERNRDTSLEAGESFAQIQTRFRRFVDGVTADAEQESVLVVAHAGVLKAGLPAVFDNVTYEFSLRNPIRNCGVIAASFENGRLHCLDWDGLSV